MMSLIKYIQEIFSEGIENMKIDFSLLDALTRQAQESPRRRMNFDLRDTPGDKSQKMLNALEPDTVVPVHRHRSVSEVVVVLRGRCVQHFYDESGDLTESVELVPGSQVPAVVVEKGRWHRLESMESGTVIMECKEGAFAPLSDEDILR